MLVCHCNILTEADIERAILKLLGADPWQLVVPAKVYHSMGRRGRCCGCFPDVVETIIRVTEAFHAGMAEAERAEAEPGHLERVRGLRSALKGRDPRTEPRGR